MKLSTVSRFVLPALALTGLAVAAYEVKQTTEPVPQAVAFARPPEVAFERYIAGAGLVEASTENIAVGATLPGKVTDVFVEVGDRVRAGQELFRVDSRSALATVAVRAAAVEAARQELSKLEQSPRPEDLPPARARVLAAEATLADARERQARLERIAAGGGAVSTDELRTSRRQTEVAEAQLAEAAAELARLESGTWAPDIAIAQAALQRAAADLAAAETEVERLLVRAPVDGQVLRVNVRVGEYAPAGVQLAGGEPLMVLGDTDTLHVRVDIDENDAWRLEAGAPARAFVRGNGELGTAATFVRIEPYVLPKRSLTGESTERVDTRVLQVIYAFDPKSLPVYVGQQMDVYVEASR